MNTATNSLTRRRFILLAGATALLPLVQPAKKLRGTPFRLAVFAPRSTLHLRLNTQFLAGINAALLQMVTEIGNLPIQFSERELPHLHRPALDTVQTFLSSNRLDAGIALAEPNAPIIDQFASANVPLTAGHIGANIDGQSTGYSLKLAQSHFALGQWTVQQYGKRVVVAASHHDSGFDALYAFLQGVNQAGGSVVQTLITHLPQQTDDGIATVWQATQRHQPDALAAFYGGLDADTFAKAWRRASMRVPLVGSRFLAEAGINEIATVMMGQVGNIVPAFQQIGRALALSVFAQQSADSLLTAAFKRGNPTTITQFTPRIPLTALRLPDIKTGWLNPFLVA